MTTDNEELVAGLRAEIAALADRLAPKPLMRATRSQFNALSPAERMAFVKRGGALHDDPGFVGMGRNPLL